MKKMLSIMTVGLLLSSNLSMAYAGDTSKISEAVSQENRYAIVINDQRLSDVTYHYDGETMMIPLRAVAEALGYSVQWRGDDNKVIVENEDKTIEIFTQRNGYGFAKENDSPLEKGAYMRDYSTYVPIQFVEGYLKASYQLDETGQLSISQLPNEELALISGYVQSVRDDGSVLVCGTGETYNEVVLYIDEETNIWDQQGQPVGMQSLIEGTEVTVTYFANVTKSLPPQAKAHHIRMVKQEKTLTGVIDSIEDNKILLNHVLGGFTSKVVLIIKDTTILQDMLGEPVTVDQLKEGMKVKVSHEGIATFSLPPQISANGVEILADI